MVAGELGNGLGCDCGAFEHTYPQDFPTVTPLLGGDVGFVALERIEDGMGILDITTFEDFPFDLRGPCPGLGLEGEGLGEGAMA